MSASVPYSPDSYPAEPYPPDAAASASAAGAVDSHERLGWWLALGAAATGVVIGFMMLVWPEATLKVVAALFGVWLLLHGVVRIVQAITRTASDGAERAIVGVIGVFFVVAGVLALRNLLASLTLLITIIGLMWLIGGIFELVSAFAGPGGRDRLWRVILATLSIVAALVVFFWPHLSLVTLISVTGVWLIVMGLIQAAMVFSARRSITA